MQGVQLAPAQAGGSVQAWWWHVAAFLGGFLREKAEPAERAGVLASSPMSGTHAPLLAGPPGCFPEPCLRQPIQSRRRVHGPPSVSTITETHRILDVAVPCYVDEQLRVSTPYAGSGWDTVRTSHD